MSKMAIFCRTSVTQAITSNNVEKLLYLFEKRRESGSNNPLNWSPLSVAVIKRRIDMVKVLLKQPEIDVNYCNVEGRTSLWIACELYKPLRIIKVLLKNNANPNIVNGKGIALLHVVCRNINLNVAKLLVEYGANINYQDNAGFTALHHAVQSNSREVIEYLLENNADTSLRDRCKMNPLMYCLFLSHKKCHADLLLSYTKELQWVTRDGYTALGIAVTKRNTQMARRLIERGANVMTGRVTPLILATMFGDFAMRKLIWQHVNYDTVSRDKQFFYDVCKLCNTLRDYTYFELILNTEGVDLHLSDRTGIFALLFDSLVAKYYDNYECKLINVTGWLLDRGVKLSDSDMTKMLDFQQYISKPDLLTFIFSKTVPNVTKDFLLGSIKYYNWKLNLFLITFCIEFDPQTMFNYALIRYIKDVSILGYLWTFFTPSHQCRLKVIETTYLFIESEELREMNQPKSLLEVSRDVVRGLLRKRCHSSEEYINVVNEMSVPTRLRDVIRCKVPINNHTLSRSAGGW